MGEWSWRKLLSVKEAAVILVFLFFAVCLVTGTHYGVVASVFAVMAIGVFA